MPKTKASKNAKRLSGSESDEPETKKQKGVEEEEEEVETTTKEEKKTKAKKEKSTEEEPCSLAALKDDDGNEYFDIGRSRRVALSEFKGKTYVNIREYFQDKSKKMMPGKKGITLNKEEWKNLLAIADQLKFPEE